MLREKWLFFSFLIIFGFLYSCKTNEINQTNYNELKLVKNKIGRTSYYILLPENWYIDEHLGPDFIVYYFCSKDDGSEESTHGGLYFGNWPSRFTEDDERYFEYIGYISSKIFRDNKKWKIYYVDDYYFSENIVKNKNGDSWERYIHLWGKGETKNELEKMIYLYRTIQ